MRSILALALCLLANSLFGQSIAVQSFEAQLAKSVKIEQLNDSVAVILTEKIGSRTGAYLQVTSDKKWATPVLDGIEITQTKTPGEWIMFAPAGRYRVLLAEFDPETGPRYTYHDAVITGSIVQPDKPTEPDKPDPPAGDFSSLTAVAKTAADALKDPATKAALAKAYRAVLPLLSGKSYSESIEVVQQARRMVLIPAMRGNPAQWNDWLKAVDAELLKLVPAGDAQLYRLAIEAVAKGLE